MRRRQNPDLQPDWRALVASASIAEANSPLSTYSSYASSPRSGITTSSGLWRNSRACRSCASTIFQYLTRPTTLSTRPTQDFKRSAHDGALRFSSGSAGRRLPRQQLSLSPADDGSRRPEMGWGAFERTRSPLRCYSRVTRVRCGLAGSAAPGDHTPGFSRVRPRSSEENQAQIEEHKRVTWPAPSYLRPYLLAALRKPVRGTRDEGERLPQTSNSIACPSCVTRL